VGGGEGMLAEVVVAGSGMRREGRAARTEVAAERMDRRWARVEERLGGGGGGCW
jgi:hypothetical protein